MNITWEIVFAFVIGSIAVARATRLLVDDDFPPVMAVREWYMRHTSDKWSLLVECPFCAAIWFAIADTAWAFISDLHWTWWLLNFLLAGAYIAAMINVRDIPPEDAE